MSTVVIPKPTELYKVFGSKSSDANFTKTEFGTGILIPSNVDWAKIANKNFEHGLESLEGIDIMRNINNALTYQGYALGYLYQQGVAEWNKYQTYPIGSLVSYNGKLYTNNQLVVGKELPQEIPVDACGNPLIECSSTVPDPDPCATSDKPDVSDKWCELVNKCEYKSEMDELKAKLNALDNAVKNLKGVEDFKFDPETGEIKLTLSNNDVLRVKHEAKIELVDYDGSQSAGFIHTTTNM